MILFHIPTGWCASLVLLSLWLLPFMLHYGSQSVLSWGLLYLHYLFQLLVTVILSDCMIVRVSMMLFSWRCSFLDNLQVVFLNGFFLTGLGMIFFINGLRIQNANDDSVSVPAFFALEFVGAFLATLFWVSSFISDSLSYNVIFGHLMLDLIIFPHYILHAFPLALNSKLRL